jgi:AI-2 transport protein TqsA
MLPTPRAVVRTTSDRPVASPGRLPWLLRLLLALAALVIITAGVRIVAPVLSTFIVALLLAQVLTPVTLWMTRRRVPLALAVALTLLAAFALIGIIVWFVTVSLGELSERLPDYGRRLVLLREQAFAFGARFGVDPTKLHGVELTDPRALVGRVASFVPVLATEVGHLVFVLLITALFLIEFAVVFARLERRTPAERTFLVRFGELTGDIQKYMGINAVVNLISVTGLAVIMLVMGIPFIATWMVLAFFLGFVPTLGGILALIPMVLITLLDQGVERALIFMAVYGVMNFFLGEVVKPKIMQRGFEIPIIAVFFALVFWNFILGPVGVILAVPLTIAVRRLYREFSADVHEMVAR